MSNITIQEKNLLAVESALVTNDLSKMSTEQRLLYYKEVCDSVGLNHLTQPLAFISLQGKITLYAKRDAADQLRKIHGVSIQILDRKVENDLYIVSVKGMDRAGRVDEAQGIIPIGGLKGADLANAMLKTETKAKRRLTLSLCGLGLIDESELDTISNISHTENPQIQNQFKNVGQTYETEMLPPPIDQAETIDNQGPVNSDDLGQYVVQCGKKYLGKKLSEISLDDIAGFIKYLDESSAKNNQALTGVFLEFHQKASAYLDSLKAV